jgi:hypothetical protein
MLLSKVAELVFWKISGVRLMVLRSFGRHLVTRYCLANPTRWFAGIRIEASMKYGAKAHILAKSIFPGTCQKQ